MPRLSDTMEEGAISTWHKKPGDKVAVGDVLVEIETDKAVMEYEAYQSGTLAEILVPEGQNADIGAPIALLDDGTGGPAPSVPAAPAQTASPERVEPTPPPPAASPSQETAPAAVSSGPADEAAQDTGNGTANGIARSVASPLVRKLARENHLDLSHVTGSGPGGRIIRADISGLLSGGGPAAAQAPSAPAAAPVVPAAAPAPAAPIAAPAPAAPIAAPATVAPAVPAAAADEVRGTHGVPITQVRRVIARRLSASASEIPHFYVTAVADAQELMDLRATLNAQLTEGGRAKVSVNDLLIRACALALRAHPDVNVSYDGDASKVMLVHDRINIGVAVAAESGLIVPVIRDADTKTVTQLGAEAKKLVALAAERKLTPEQTSGGTFSISNLGMFGVEHFTAIINPPEAAILAVGATTREPAIVGDTVQPRYRLRYTLSVDHRVVDGALAAKFLQTLTSLIEHPWMIIA
ncbi:2-oxo acid dehydrogenase subunit E2 [Trebonia kvetii]|uniref:Dihydrolipoamide acetyltransferase component of pyruvate dehydrogenase complex n=2 Tax=Trebonia kvetii TaxID=2480626 RepID=A0A6P2CAC0_9ACTN|nr:2-oxo acid dehydrogenase subunit E2 [Trebonia kvetii]